MPDVADWRRFRRAVLPLAPWVFAAPTIGFVTLPGLVRGLDELRTVYAGVATAVVPAAGLLIQPLARRLAVRHRLAAAVSGPAVVALGFLLAAPAAAAGAPVLSLVAAVIFGAGYGLLLTFCLTEVAAVAPPHHLARVTSLFWTAAYLGMFAPYAVTLLSGAFAVFTLMCAGAGLAVLTCGAAATLARRDAR
ncbi:Major Facilitator Superfamily protein [Streptoalloteichus tenebrarius]|uniref:Major Facilitator Superfamily protein n=1 Tax=Streptoalloteichus tenebrarius (strain ATCC 17920 / DSM 40477 / JCM 4838 / CBS 697.72 / NBRC 16177 / NCIMB 11028 / NRRL B-12390 / A12253. 1 / ISP 5477) TaxID=1933 RepID=A0ABT1HQ86_STRSD|nr:Major Facilitator Superfamily protein [Streptoalloteichus tenebrarius]BFE98634.1 hypothetical protein GCM10020241_03100 [Streptoalloteichus tenebrarius]